MIRTPAWRGLVAVVCVSVPAAAAQPLAVPFFKQYKNGCGAASVAMVLHYWKAANAASPRSAYEQLYDPARRGISLAALKRYVEQAGLRAFTLRGRWSDLEQHLARGRPLIVALSGDKAEGMHFAVLTGIDKDRVWLNDPTRRKAVRMNRTDFGRRWESADCWLLLAAPAGAPSSPDGGSLPSLRTDPLAPRPEVD